ncbi:MAG: hypothetical protein AABN95_11585 [Acidobacteriota bacterium]
MTPRGSLAPEERNVLDLRSHRRKHCAPLERGTVNNGAMNIWLLWSQDLVAA